MKGFVIEKNKLSQDYITYQLSADQLIEKFAVQWLSSHQNSFFLPWEIYSNYTRVSLYANITHYKSLQYYLDNTEDVIHLKSIIMQICKALIYIKNSLLVPSKILLDLDYIFMIEDKPKSVEIKLIYLPIADQQVESKFSELDLLKALILRYMKWNKRLSKNMQLLLLDKANSTPEELLNYLETMEEKQSVNLQVKKLMDTVHEKDIFKWTKNYPLIILVMEMVLLIIIFTLDFILGSVPLRLLMLIIAVIVFLFIWQLLLLLIPSSPFYIFSKEKLRKKIEQNTSKSNEVHEGTDTFDKSLIRANPIENNRRAQIEVVQSSYSHLEDTVWQIYTTDFLVGSDKSKVNIYIPNETEEIVLRICQRSGNFYCQALSSTVAVFLMDRMMYRYEDYLLPENCFLKINNTKLKFKIY